VNDDPSWEDNYPDEGMEYDGGAPGEELLPAEDENHWESVGEWASTVFIVHAVIISEAEKWPSSTHCEWLRILHEIFSFCSSQLQQDFQLRCDLNSIDT